jgi:beta-N-acetylhexosaminidase
VSAGSFLIVGIPGPRLDEETRRILAGLRPGGVILFRRNVESVEQVQELTGGLRTLLPETVLWVDGEGGRVDRLKEVLAPAPAGESLAVSPPALARRAGLWIGHGLRALGFDGDFAPVVDLDHGIAGNALDGRCLGGRPRAVIARGRAFLDGLHRAGIGGCLKHFPGLGAAPADTHHRAATIGLSRQELEPELDPFRRLSNEAGAVMVGHALYPSWDRERPASLSPVILEERLRRDLGFEGLAVSDDVEMEGLAPWAATPAERAEAAFAAGCDAVLVCHRLEQAVAAAGRLAVSRLAERREVAEKRWRFYRRHLAHLRYRAPARRFRVATVRRRLGELVEAVG